MLALTSGVAWADDWSPPGHPDRCLLPGTHQIREACPEAISYGIIVAVPLPRERPDTCEYDGRHRTLLPEEVRSRLPDRCIEDLAGDYPTRAAAWAAAIDRELNAVPKTKRADITPPTPCPPIQAAPKVDKAANPIGELVQGVQREIGVARFVTAVIVWELTK